jgi:regulatory protein
MMKITALKVNPRNKARVKVYLDGQYAFSLAKIEAARLRLNQELDQAAVERLQRADADEQAYERALKFLAVRPRSEAEVRRRLREHEVKEAQIEAVLARLRSAGLLDDQAFANYWVENRAAFRPKSKRLLRVELKRKGVSDAALGEALEAANDAEAAYQVAARRAARLSALPFVEFRRKLGDFLARRGFDYDTVEPVVNRVWKEMQAGKPDARV